MARLTRRNALQHLMIGSLASTSFPSIACMNQTGSPLSLKGNIRHSVCRWCYNSIPRTISARQQPR